eukprot:CAMPEP_0182418074 /NCGR_PEP_ID=MMETSP1167-20130531/2532_1 /TAXON_ID=2988 /ORGANISM="Mallomonas Sp, Strain CCMP3275" /LENGTH=338 /DNA_ID=CAMNT_0024592057 /DNA_START=1 /DNA_END=1017 /DNA_ORIENTATION=-
MAPTSIVSTIVLSSEPSLHPAQIPLLTASPTPYQKDKAGKIQSPSSPSQQIDDDYYNEDNAPFTRIPTPSTYRRTTLSPVYKPQGDGKGFYYDDYYYYGYYDDDDYTAPIKNKIPTPYPTPSLHSPPGFSDGQKGSIPTPYPTPYAARPTIPTPYPSPYEAHPFLKKIPHPTTTPTHKPSKKTTHKPTHYPSPYPTRYPTSKQPSPTPTRYPVLKTAWPTRNPVHKPSGIPSLEPTQLVKILTEEQIFGFDVGSRAANIITLIALLLLMIWLALSTAYCLTRNKAKDERKVARKTRQQKFEEYWGEVDDTAHSSTAFNIMLDGDSIHSLSSNLDLIPH